LLYFYITLVLIFMNYLIMCVCVAHTKYLFESQFGNTFMWWLKFIYIYSCTLTLLYFLCSLFLFYSLKFVIALVIIKPFLFTTVSPFFFFLRLLLYFVRFDNVHWLPLATYTICNHWIYSDFPFLSCFSTHLLLHYSYLVNA
jgi:hypothetical protein